MKDSVGLVIPAEAKPSGGVRLRWKGKFRPNPDVSAGLDMTKQHLAHVIDY